MKNLLRHIRSVAVAWLALAALAGPALAYNNPNNIPTVPSVAALRTSMLGVASGTGEVWLTSYSGTAPDGSEGAFKWSPASTATDDGGLVIQVAGVATGRWLRETQSQPYSVRWWGAKCDGSTNDTVAMNAAHATAQLIYYPAGTCNFTTLAPIAGGGIAGQGRSGTILSSTDTSSANLIVFNNSATTPLFRDFTLLAPQSGSLPVKSGGAGIQLNPTTSEIQYAHFDNVTIAFLPIDLDMVAASYWTVTNCEFLGYNFAGIQVANTNNPDSGDSVIQGTLFNTPGTLGSGIRQRSSGGLKVVGNKFLGGATGYTMVLDATSNTSDLLFVGNSVENMASQGMAFTRASGTAIFTNVVISGDQFAVMPTGIQTDASNFLSEVTITGSDFNLSSGGGFGIQLSTVTDFNISGDTFKGNGGAPTGISIISSSSNGKIGKNTYATLATTVSNGSTTTLVDGDIQSGSANITTSTALGALFAGSATITFPTPYTTVPTVNAVATSIAGGGISAQAGSVTVNGFTLTAVGATNGGSVGTSWTAQGVK